MENILAKLVEPDNSSITEGTVELQEALKQPEAIGQLCNIIVSHQNVTIRHYAAVVLRKKFSKSFNWNKVSASDKEILKNVMLKALIDEPEKQVKTAICQFVAHLANHELPKNNWPELIQLLEGLNTSNDLNQRELGMYTLGIVLEISGVNFKDTGKKLSMCNLFNSTLNSLPDMSLPLAHLTVTAMHHYMLATDDGSLNYDWKKVFATIGALAKKRPDKALECLDILDDVMNMDNLTPQHLDFVELCTLVLQIAEHADDDDLQEKALNVLSSVIRAKVKPSIFTKKSGLIDMAIDVLLKLMSSAPEDDTCEEYYIDNEANSCSVYAASALDDMAICIAPTKLMNALQEKIAFYLNNEDPYKRKGGYIALASVAEGASLYIRNNFIKVFVDYALKGILDGQVVVQNAALFALGQMSEYLQPEMSNSAENVMPILMNFLNNISNTPNTPPEHIKHVERIFYALESFIETMEHSAINYVPTLMEAFYRIIENPGSLLQLKEFTIRAIGSIATAIEKDFMPYFQSSMAHLAACVDLPASAKGQGDDYRVSALQNAAVEAIGTLARAVGEENFRPYAVQSVELGLRMVNDTMDDPETMKVVFQLFGSVSTILKQEMIHLPNIVELILNSIESSNEYVPQMKDSNGLNVFMPDDDDDEDDNNGGTVSEEDIDFDESRSDDDDEIEGYTYDVAKIDEKEEALDAISEFAKVIGPAFQPYIKRCFDIVYKALHHPHEGVRQNAIDTMVQLSIASQSEEESLKNILQTVVPKLREIIKTDDSKDVVIRALGGYRDVLVLGPIVVESPGHLEAIFNSIKEVLNKKTDCQDNSDGDDDDDDEAEKEEQVIEGAGEILPALAKAVPPVVFANIFGEILTNLSSRLSKSMDNENLEYLKSFIVGIIAECIPGLGDQITSFIPTLLPILTKFCKDKGSDIKQNSVYGIGVLAATAKESLIPEYPNILSILYDVLQKDKNGAVVDNVCAAICRLIIVSSSNVPLERVIPVLIENLPLKEDLEETSTVLECLCMLYKDGKQILLNYIPQMVKICIFMLVEEKKYLSAGNSRDMNIGLLTNIMKDFPQESESALNGASQAELQVYQSIRSTLLSS